MRQKTITLGQWQAVYFSKLPMRQKTGAGAGDGSSNISKLPMRQKTLPSI